MARKDEIYLSFLNHELIQDKYEINKNDLPKNLREGLESEHTLLKALALIVEDTESHNPSSDKSLYTKISQFLSKESI